MKKHVLGMIAALFVFVVLLPVGARAADTAYAILYDDGTLVFQNSETPETGRTAKRRYTVDLNRVYDNKTIPWYEERGTIRVVSFKDRLSPTSTAYWFYDTGLVRMENVSNLDTSNVTTMDHMFYSCSILTELDLSNFDTAKVNDMNHMFWCCFKLETIYASSKFTTASLKSKFRGFDTNGTMFSGCKVLVGGNGTEYSDKHKDWTYARIDTLDTPGYFTYKAAPTPTTYTVTWKNYDGTVLKTDTNIESGTIPLYSGEAPIRTGYAFAGWYPQPSAVTGNVTYTATFEAVSATYTVLWQNYDGAILKADTNVSAGTFPAYNGATPARSGYAFAGWYPQPSAVTENVTYTAQFTEIAAPSFDVRRDAYQIGNSMQDFGYKSRGGKGGGQYPIPPQSFFMIFGEGVRGQLLYMNAANSPWSGNCAGMSASAALLFAYGKLNPADFGKDNAWSLAIGDKNAEMSLLTFIEAMQAAQYTTAFGQARQANQVRDARSMNNLYQAVKGDMEKGRPTLIAIVKNGVGGHALLAVGTDDAGKRILIYDCNHPGELRYLTLSGDAGWSYDMGGYGVWGSGDAACSISYVPYAVLEDIWANRGALKQDCQALTVNASDVSITDFQGNPVATLENGKLVKSAEGVYEMVDLSMYWPEERIICLPRNKVYTVSTGGGAELTASMTDGHMSAAITTSANSVTFGVNDDERANVVTIPGASASDTYSISLQSDFADFLQKTVELSGTGQGQDINVSMTRSRGVTFVNCNITSLSVDGEDVYAITAAKWDKSGKLSATLINPKAATFAVAYFGENGKFVSANLQDVSTNAGTVTSSVPANAKTARVMLFDKECRPLCEPYRAAVGSQG